MDLNKLVTTIQALSGSEADLKSLKTQLTKSEDVLLKNLGMLDDALSNLDPSRHSLGWLFILSVKAMAPRTDGQRFVSQTQAFIQACNPQQIQLAVHKFVKVCHRLQDILIEVRQPIRGVLPLKTAIAKLRDIKEGQQLTSIHTDFLQLCLLSKAYNAALPVLEDNLTEINEASGITPKDLLCYFYYGGRVYIGMKQYKKALEFFKLVLTTPAIVLSAIMVEAFKKYILVSLILTGQVAPLPKYVSSVVHRHIKNVCPQYQEFAGSFSTHNSDEVHKCAAVHADLFRKDGNFGIVKQCIQSLDRNNIKRLTQTYLTLSLQDIAVSVKLPGPADAERAVLKMIEAGEIFATINQRDGMVSFSEDPERFNTNTMMQQIDSQINKVVNLEKKLRVVDDAISIAPSYVQKTSGHDRHAGRWGEMDEGGFGDSDKAFAINKF
jgi:COP9 signalosome complex subunit 3